MLGYTRNAFMNATYNGNNKRPNNNRNERNSYRGVSIPRRIAISSRSDGYTRCMDGQYVPLMFPWPIGWRYSNWPNDPVPTFAIYRPSNPWIPRYSRVESVTSSLCV